MVKLPDQNELKKQVFESQVWRSIFRHSYQDNPRNRVPADRQQRLAPPAPGEDAAPRDPSVLYVVRRRSHLLFFLVTVATGVVLISITARSASTRSRHPVLEFDVPFAC